MIRRLLLCLILAGFLPLASAQSGLPQPVEGCSQECRPQDADVNGPEPKTSGPIKTILYAHFPVVEGRPDIFNRVPLNTQIITDPEATINSGPHGPIILHTNTGNPTADLHFGNNWFEFYSSPGLVHLDESGQDRRTHQEEGLASDVKIEGDTLQLYLYLSAHPVPNANSDTTHGKLLPDAMPLVGVYARMETGRARFGEDSLLIAEGDTDPDDSTPLVGEAAKRMTLVSLPGQSDIYEIKVPLKVLHSVIPNDKGGFLVSVNVYQLKGKSGPLEDYHVMQQDWRLRFGPNTPPRLVVPLANPLETKHTELLLYDGKLFIRWSFISPLGSYDVADIPQSLHLEIEGPKVPSPNLISTPRIKFNRDHEGHFVPINVTWQLDHLKAGLPDGEYTIRMHVLNLQETYRLEERVAFTMKSGTPENLRVIGRVSDDKTLQENLAGKNGLLPGFEPLLLFVAALGSLFLLRRREP